MQSGNLNFLEASGPLQACNGTALPFFFGQILKKFCVTEKKISTADFRPKTRLNKIGFFGPNRKYVHLNDLWDRQTNVLLSYK
jgi:hypothetical protein